MEERIAIPARSRVILERLITQRDSIVGQMEAFIEGMRTALDVPDGYVLRTVDEGFVAPTAPAEEQAAVEE